MNFCFPLFLLLLLTFQPSSIQQQSPSEQIDIPVLLRESEQNTNQNCVKTLARLSDYTYKARWIKREQRKDGTVEEESSAWEYYVPDLKKARARNRRVRTSVLIEKNGRPLAPDKIEKERRKVAERLVKDEERPPDPDGHVPASCQWEGKYTWLTAYYEVKKAGLISSVYGFDTPTLLANCEFHAPQRATLQGRSMITLDFRPRPAAIFEQRMRWVADAEGKIWIDELDKLIVAVALWPRREPPPATSAAHLRQVAAVFYEQVRMKDGLWFFGHCRFDASRFPETATIWKKEIINEHYDHVEFIVQAEKEKLIVPGKPPARP